jgi:hypothetical protein
MEPRGLPNSDWTSRSSFEQLRELAERRKVMSDESYQKT